MANSTYGRVWTLDTIGLITRKPIWIRKIILFPNATGDSTTLYYWDESDTIATGVGSAPEIDGDITGNDTLTLDSGSKLPSTITDGSIFEIMYSNGDQDNVGKPMVIQTAGNDTVVVIHKIPAADQWDNETNVRYAWKTYQNRLAVKLVAETGDTGAKAIRSEVYDFGPNGFRFPNLTLETLSSSATINIYIA